MHVWGGELDNAELKSQLMCFFCNQQSFAVTFINIDSDWFRVKAGCKLAVKLGEVAV